MQGKACLDLTHDDLSSLEEAINKHFGAQFSTFPEGLRGFVQPPSHVSALISSQHTSNPCMYVLAVELDLPPAWRIHPVVSITQLTLAPSTIDNQLSPAVRRQAPNSQVTAYQLPVFQKIDVPSICVNCLITYPTVYLHTCPDAARLSSIELSSLSFVHTSAPGRFALVVRLRLVVVLIARAVG